MTDGELLAWAEKLAAAAAHAYLRGVDELRLALNTEIETTGAALSSVGIDWVATRLTTSAIATGAAR